MPVNTVINTINQYSMIKSGDRVVVALSGGADSVCLLHILNNLKKSMNFTLEAVHINHCIRGKESDGDENFCVKLCQKYDIPLKIYRENIPELTKISGKSTEETARDVRYNKFAEASGINGKIATAHTLSDNAETVMFNMIRGTGLKGLCGIPPVRGNIIRPLINITRRQVEKYLSLINQNYKTDSTNLSDEYTRNKIRHKIIPVMEEINGGFFKSFFNCLQTLKEENNYIESISKKEYDLHFKNNALVNISDIPQVIRKRVISIFLSNNNLPVSFEKINEIDNICIFNGKLNICKDTYVISKNQSLYIEKSTVKTEYKEITVKIGVNQIFDNKSLLITKEKKGKNIIDADKISGELKLHSRKYGDKINLAGRSFTSSVKKLLNENVPEQERPYIQYLSDEEGLVFMEGFGIAERLKPTEISEKFLSIEIV